jgi:16S rRNA (cytosine1402-N4)-methyltransferase
MIRGRRSTPSGQHRPVLLDEVLRVLDPQPGQTIVDATVGWAGHAIEILRRLGPDGRLIGLDLDRENLPRAHERLHSVGASFTVHHANFAGLPALVAAEGVAQVDGVLADLGMSSMQVDDPARGFSYARSGPLDMRMDRTRGRTAAQLLAELPPQELAQALRDLGDEPEAERIATAIVKARRPGYPQTTVELAQLILETVQPGYSGQGWRLHPAPHRWNLHPAARTFQALRILVNRELGNLEQLLRVLPDLVRAGGKAVIVSFHSGEDRLVKAAFKEGRRQGVYARISAEPVRPTEAERLANPRARSAKLRWAERR